MYTTIRMLQTNSACIPGFTRTVTFFGTGPAMRDTPIPLWAIGITNNTDDFTWALGNACVIDPTMYQQFREKTLLPYFHQRYFRHERTAENVKNQAAKLAVQEAATIETYEQVVQYLDKYKDHIMSGNNWFSDLHKLAWSSPSEYIQAIWNDYADSASSRFLRSPHGKKHMELYEEDAVNINHFRVAHKLSHAEGFAAICLGHRNVHSELLKFVADHKIFSRRRRGAGNVILDQTAEGKFTASVSVEDPKSVFTVLRLLTMQNATKSTLLDQIHDSFNNTAEGLDSSMSYADAELSQMGEASVVQEVRNRVERESSRGARSRRVSTVRARSTITDDDDDGDESGDDRVD